MKNSAVFTAGFFFKRKLVKTTFGRKENGPYHLENTEKIKKFLFCSLSFLQHPICTIKCYYLSICSKFRDWWHPIWCNKRQATPFSCLWSMSFANVVMIKLLQIDPLDWVKVHICRIMTLFWVSKPKVKKMLSERDENISKSIKNYEFPLLWERIYNIPTA